MSASGFTSWANWVFTAMVFALPLGIISGTFALMSWKQVPLLAKLVILTCYVPFFFLFLLLAGG
jgi:hypothetical protein